MTRTLLLRRLALSIPLAAGSGVSLGDPGYYVVTAYPNEGLRSVDLRYWTTREPGEATSVWPEAGFGYGVSSRWYTELYASWVRYEGGPMRLSTWNWQNEFMLTQGEWPVDVAMHLNIVRQARAADGYAIEAGPVLQTDLGRTQLNLNVFLERSVASGQSSETQMKYQWQLRHRWTPLLHVGAQGFGELGTWNRWSPHNEQSHRAGPALFGTVRFDDKQAFLWQAAYLYGKVYGERGRMFTARAQYVF